MERAAIRRRSFSAAAGLLPRTLREPTLRLYAACRALDDLADAEGGPRARKSTGSCRP
ncbi:squalene/phytoene synthase family protein [Rhodosalinus sp.]|uniref:squalene/phytoene synthase family protein n=1 Tax=Rhodosalinus sp. TaxID=2047741 RepID=UPI00397E60D1